MLKLFSLIILCPSLKEGRENVKAELVSAKKSVAVSGEKGERAGGQTTVGGRSVKKKK